MGVGYISPLPCKFCLSTDVGRQSAKKCRHVKSKDDGNDQVTENAHTCYQGEDGNVALLSCVSGVLTNMTEKGFNLLQGLKSMVGRLTVKVNISLE